MIETLLSTAPIYNFSPGPAAYVDSGYWSRKAIPESRREGIVEVVWSGRAGGVFVEERHLDGHRRTLVRWDVKRLGLP